MYNVNIFIFPVNVPIGGRLGSKQRLWVAGILHDLGSCEYVRKVLGLYAARRDEVCVGVGSLEVRAVGRKPKDAGTIIYYFFTTLTPSRRTCRVFPL